MPSFFQEIDVFVHVPTSRTAEAFGLVYLEALASGVTCIFTLSGIVAEFPSLSSHFFKVDYRSSDEIRDTIAKIILKTAIVPDMIEPKELDLFDLEVMITKYMKLLGS
jgi:glycosyltransferase involved in cell wall biosynthesis